ncbi:mitochondrial 2-enoyl thioester reductase, partial [Dipsacomyces acuminosporus]
EVVEVGSQVQGLRAGDWVVPQRSGEFGTWCTHVVAKQDQIARIPEEWREGLDPLQVASVKVNPSTGYRLLRDFAQLNPGDYVIQNGANSGVGRAVIQLAKPLGVRTINVIRDRGNFDELVEELHSLGADLVIKDKDLLKDETKSMLKSLASPVRLGFNCVGGKMTLAMTKFISQGGTLVSYGGMSRQPVALPTSLLLFKDIRARGFWMNRWYNANKGDSNKQRDEMWADILQLARQQRFITQPMHRVEWQADASEESIQEKVRGALTATLDHANNEVLVYQDSLGLLRGQLHITTKDKLKLKHVSIKLVRDELVDIADNDTAASGLYTNLQKASKTINTWAVLEERSGTQHILPEGAHKYSFELSLPVGLDSSVDTPSYKLNYFLESRVKYSSILKPDYALRTPITLVQVPTIGNLYSDDNVSLAIGPLPAGVSIESLNPLDIPVGQSVRLRNDVLDQAGQFVLRHVWDNKLAFRLTLPKGRSLFAGTKPVVEIETLPIAKGFRFTKVTLTLEEVVIMARPQKSGVQQGTISISEYQHTGGSGSSTSNNKTSSEGSIRRSGRKGSVASKHSSAGPSSSLMHPGHGQSLTNQSLNSITSISSNDDNKSIHSVASFTSQNHALALARDSSSEYSSAIAKTRELSTTTIVLPTSSLSAISSPDVNFSSTAEHGFLIARTRMTAPPLSEKGAHTDMSNSHIQIHHQISYTLEYKKVDADADSFVPHNSEGTSFDGGISASIHPRINAVAAMYKGLSEANILPTGGDFSSDFSSMAQRHPTLANNPMFLQQLVMFYEHQIAQRDAFVKQLTSQYLQILQAEKQQQQQPQLQPQLQPPLQTQLQPQPQLQQDLGISMTSRPLNSVTSTNPMHSFANDPAFLAQQPFSSIINPAISSIHPNPAHAATASDSRLPALDAMSILSQQSMMSMSQGDPLRPAEPALHPGLNIRSAASANPMDMLSNPLLSSPTMHSFGLQPTQFAPSSSSHLHFGGAESSRTAARAAPSITGSPPTTANATIATASSPVNGANGVPATRQINSVVDEHADYGSPPPHYEAVPSALLQQPVVSQPPPYDRRV